MTKGKLPSRENGPVLALACNMEYIKVGKQEGIKNGDC
jgi:hypothetical protein